MKEAQVTKLTQLYNTLLMISTRGEDTMIMAECLKALQQIVEEGAKEAGMTLQRGPQVAEESEQSAPVDAEVVED